MKNRDIKRKSFASIIIAISGIWIMACRTTKVEDHIVVDSNSNDGLIYSTIDQRTTMINSERQSDLKALKERINDQLKAEKNDLESMAALAQVHVALGEFQQAESLCRTLLRKDLKNQDARKILGQIAIKRKQYDLALIHLSNVGGVNSKDSSVVNMLAQIELAKNRPDIAMSLFKTAIRLDPNDHAARMNLGVLYIKHRQMGLASIEFERILQSEPSHSDAKTHLAIVLIARGESDKAQEILEEVVDFDPTNPIALYSLAVISKHKKDYDAAIDYMKQYTNSGRGKPSDNQQVFALINKIQSAQSVQGDSVSDEDIQEMAKDMQKNQKQRAQKTQSESKVARSTVAKPKPKAPASTPKDAEDIADLEQAIK